MQFVQLGPRWTVRGLVLVVDEEPAIRAVMARFLRQRGVAVVEARNGTQGLALLPTARFDAVITEVELAGYDGFAFWERATAGEPRLKGRFLFCTSADVDGQVARIGERYVMKPFTLDELWEAIEPLLG